MKYTNPPNPAPAETDMSDAIERLKDVSRTILNAVWRQDGCEGVEEVERLARLCPKCGYERSDLLHCPICEASSDE